MSDVSPTILVLVDDDADVLAALKFSFEVEGFEVHAYPDSESLLAESDSLQPGCLVLDYKLPGINGLELLKILRSRGVKWPAVLITTPTRDVLDRAAKAGVPVVEKPLLTNALLKTIRGLLERGPQGIA